MNVVSLWLALIMPLIEQVANATPLEYTGPFQDSHVPQRLEGPVS